MSSQRIIEVINNHALNKSKSKQAHSFSRAQRFPKHRQSTSQSFIDFYPSESSQSKLQKSIYAPKFGHERRFRQRDQQMKNKSLTPSPQHYDYISPSKSKEKSVSFTRAKKPEKKQNYSPGPGQYESKQYFTSHRSVSKSRSHEKRRHTSSTNPEAYNLIHSPRFGHSQGSIIGNSKRWNQLIDQTPSPNHYNLNQSYYNSNHFKNRQGGVSFTKSKRKSFLDQRRLQEEKTTPGPGSYENNFSEFSEGSKRILQRLMRL